MSIAPKISTLWSQTDLMPIAIATMNMVSLDFGGIVPLPGFYIVPGEFVFVLIQIVEKSGQERSRLSHNSDPDTGRMWRKLFVDATTEQ